MNEQSDIEPHYILITASGIEDILEKELNEMIPGTHLLPFPYLGGYRSVGNVPLSKLLELRSIRRIVRVFRIFDFDQSMDTIRNVMGDTSFPILERVHSFRITTSQYGPRYHKAIAIQSAAGEIIQNRYQLKVDLKHYDANVLVDFIGNKGFTGVQETVDKFDHRHSRVFYHQAGVRTSTAYAMLRLANIKAGQTLLDPFAGGGTIPLEAASLYGANIKIIAGDSDQEALLKAKNNAESADLSRFISFYHMDARELEETLTEKVDCIVANLPYGFKTGVNANIRTLYTDFLNSAARILYPLGKLIIMTQRGSLLRHILYEQQIFALEHERLVSGGALKPHIMKLRLLSYNVEKQN